MGLAFILAFILVAIPFLIGVVLAITSIARRKRRKLIAFIMAALTLLIALPSYLVPYSMAEGNIIKQIELHTMGSIVVVLASIAFSLVEKITEEDPRYVLSIAGLLSLISNPVIHYPVAGIILYPVFFSFTAFKAASITNLSVAAFFVGCFAACLHLGGSLDKRYALMRLAQSTTLIALIAYFLPILLVTLEPDSNILVLHDQAAIVLMATGLVTVLVGKVARRQAAYLYASATLLATAVHPNVYPVLGKSLLSLV